MVEMVGYSILYKEFTTVVLLRENERSKLDKRNTEYLELARFGIYTPEMKKYLESRVLGKEDQIKWQKQILKHALDFNIKRRLIVPIVFATNEMKEDAARLIMTELLQKQNEESLKIYRLNATFYRITGSGKNKKTPISVKDLQDIYSFPPNKLGNRAAILDIFIGMPVILQDDNADTEHAYANGVIGFIYDILWPSYNEDSGREFLSDNEKFTIIVDKTSGGDRFVPKPGFEPIIIFIDIPTYDGKRADGLPPAFPNTVIPIFKRKLVTRVNYRDPKSRLQRQCQIVMEQFNILQALTISIHKIQGLTVDGLLIGSLREKHPTMDTAALYVCWSRNKFGDTLGLMFPINKKDYEYFKPSRTQFIEYLRLYQFHIRTLKEHGASKDEEPPFPRGNKQLQKLEKSIYSEELKYMFTSSAPDE